MRLQQRGLRPRPRRLVCWSAVGQVVVINSAAHRPVPVTVQSDPWEPNGELLHDDVTSEPVLQLDTVDRVEYGAALLSDLVAAGL